MTAVKGDSDIDRGFALLVVFIAVTSTIVLLLIFT